MRTVGTLESKYPRTTEIIGLLHVFGRTTSYEVMVLLDVTIEYARTMIWELRKAGKIEKCGLVDDPTNRGGRSYIVYKLA